MSKSWFTTTEVSLYDEIVMSVPLCSSALSEDNVIKYSSLFVLVLQNTSLVLFMRYAMTGNRPKFLKALMNGFKENLPRAQAIGGIKSVTWGLAQIYDQFVHHWRDALKVLVPAVVYTIQNFLLYVAVENLPAATYMDQKMSNDREKAERLAAAVVNDISTTEMPTIEDAFTRLMDSTPDVVNNTTLAPAALGEMTRPKREVHEQNSILGFIAVLVACCLSGFAGIYFEKILKGSDVSIWIRNIQLALPSIFFALLFAF
ncbi:UDP-galactose translocator domain protein, partial [Teladorsagia circumcincta]